MAKAVSKDVFTLRLDSEKIQRLDDEATRRGVGRSEVARRAMLLGLEMLEAQNAAEDSDVVQLVAKVVQERLRGQIKSIVATEISQQLGTTMKSKAATGRKQKGGGK